MSEFKISITEAELEIMKVIWASKKPVTTLNISDNLNHKTWKYSTIATLCGRMVEKGVLSYEKKGRFYYYTPTITESEYMLSQTEQFISKLYNGSVKNLVVSLFENNKVSDEDIAEIKKMFDL